MKIKLEEVAGSIAKLAKSTPKKVGIAVTRAMHATGRELKSTARANIASSGMGKKMQNALRVTTYPKLGVSSLSPAIYITHNTRWGKVYEEGGTILGKPFMWLALPSIPKMIGRERMTPARFMARVGPLINIKGGSKPLLGARVTVTRSKLRKNSKFTLKSLRTGLQKAGVNKGLGIIRVIPAFVGIPMVKVKKRFNLRSTFSSAAAVFKRFFKIES